MSQERKRSVGTALVNDAIASCSMHLDFAWTKTFRNHHPTTKALHALACGAAPIVEAFSEFEELGLKYGAKVPFGATARQWANAVEIAGEKHEAQRHRFANIRAHQSWERIARDYIGSIFVQNIGAKCNHFSTDLPE